MILARWLMGVTMAVAEKAPDDEHAQLLEKKHLSLSLSLPQVYM